MELFDTHLFTLVKSFQEQFSFARGVGLVIGVRPHRPGRVRARRVTD